MDAAKGSGTKAVRWMSPTQLEAEMVWVGVGTVSRLEFPSASNCRGTKSVVVVLTDGRRCVRAIGSGAKVQVAA